MSRSYRRCYCKLAAGVESDHPDKKRSSRTIRRANKKKVAEAKDLAEHEPSRPYLTKKNVEVFNFASDGKVECDPKLEEELGIRSGFYYKKLAKGKLRMNK